MRMRPTMLLATLLAVGLMPITAQAQQQGNQRPTPRQTIQNTDPEDTYEGTPDSRRGTATQERAQSTTPGRTQGTIQRSTTQGATTERSAQFRGDSATAGSQNVDQQISLMAAAELAIMNDCEIKTAQMAQEKIDNEQVKQFAQTMIRDHQQLNQQLMQAMPELRGMVQLHSSDRTSQSTTQSTQSQTAQSDQSRTRGVDSGLQSSPDRQAGTQGQAQSGQQARTGDQSDNRTAQGTQPGQQGQQAQSGTIRSQESELSSSAREQATGYRGTATQEGSGSMNPVMTKMLSICQEKAQNKLEMTRQEFSEKQGKELEMCYMGSQVVMHQSALAHLKALQDEGTPEFQQIVQQAEETVQQHLTQAKSIVEDLSKQDDSQSSSRDNQTRSSTSPNASGSASPGGVPNGQNN